MECISETGFRYKLILHPFLMIKTLLIITSKKVTVFLTVKSNDVHNVIPTKTNWATKN